MAWTPDRWPLAACDRVDTAYFNELADELNARHGTAAYPAALADGDSTFGAVTGLRVAINNVLQDFYDGDGNGEQFAAVSDGDSGSGIDAKLSIFKKLFGGSRLAWKNEPDGTEGAGPLWQPSGCSEPYDFLLNELHDVIDLLKWRAAPMADDIIYRKAAGSLLYTHITKQAALDQAHAWASVPPWGVIVQDWPGANLYGTTSDVGVWSITIAGTLYYNVHHVRLYRVRHQTASPLPAGSAGCLICYYLTAAAWDDRYETADGVFGSNPAWTVPVYAALADPGAATWNWGALAGTLTPGTTGTQKLNPVFAADSKLYFQDRLPDDKTQHVVDSGYWAWSPADPGFGQTYRKLYTGSPGSCNIRVLYRLVS